MEWINESFIVFNFKIVELVNEIVHLVQSGKVVVANRFIVVVSDRQTTRWADEFVRENIDVNIFSESLMKLFFIHKIRNFTHQNFKGFPLVHTHFYLILLFLLLFINRIALLVTFGIDLTWGKSRFVGGVILGWMSLVWMVFVLHRWMIGYRIRRFLIFLTHWKMSSF